MKNINITCHLCSSPFTQIIKDYSPFYRVTSDCKPWQAGGKLLVCKTCGCVQKSIDRTWNKEIQQIYSNYSIYHQSGGAEQNIFIGHSGEMHPRSLKLFEFLNVNTNLKEKGKMLDVGCGNGAFLSVFSKFKTSWSLAGLDLDNKYKSIIENIKNVEALYNCNIKDIQENFEFISMIHVLEHIPKPQIFLNYLRQKQTSGGLLLVDIPNFIDNPFDLLIADHCTHFTKDTATDLLENAGYNILNIATDYIPKELIIIAQKVDTSDRKKTKHSAYAVKPLLNRLKWLKLLVEKSRKISNGKKFGIFGTAIAATWLFSELNQQVQFFVDEDPNRSGKKFMGRPVYKPEDIPNNCNVFIPLPNSIAEIVKKRLYSSKIAFNIFTPPPMKL